MKPRLRQLVGLAAIPCAAALLFVSTHAVVGDKPVAPPSPSDAGCRTRARPGADEVVIPGGTFRLGSDGGRDGRFAEEALRREVTVAPFAIDRTEVTNAQFAAFVRETGYVTAAERTPPPGSAAPAELQGPGAAVFVMDGAPGWRFVPGADWRHPLGPGSSIAGLANHPVTMVTFADAHAYARWAARDIPSEAEWEWAARSGPGDEEWGDPKAADGHWRANIWQGIFPVRNLGNDGHLRTAPVSCFPPNARGLDDMIGNVWELTADTYAVDASGVRSHVIKGGSFLCAANYCARYRPTARQPAEADLGMSNVGFRTIRRLVADSSGRAHARSTR